jgi:rRNA maturation endonuclease Nob1
VRQVVLDRGNGDDHSTGLYAGHVARRGNTPDDLAKDLAAAEQTLREAEEKLNARMAERARAKVREPNDEKRKALEREEAREQREDERHQDALKTQIEALRAQRTALRAQHSANRAAYIAAGAAILAIFVPLIVKDDVSVTIERPDPAARSADSDRSDAGGAKRRARQARGR